MSDGPGDAAGPAQAGPGPAGLYFVDATGGMGFAVGEGNTVINNYVYNGLTWSDGVAPPPLASVSGAVESPYRGLGAFEERDAAFFFGREEAAAQVLERMSGLAGGRGLLVVSGASGAGKSSLLRAGVLPRLREAGLAAAPRAASWPCLVLTPGRAPLDELAVRVSLLAGTDAAAVRRGLEADPARFALTARAAALASPPAARETGSPMAPQAPGEGRLLLIVDQFEQVFTQCADEAERQAFITALSSAAGMGQDPGGAPAALVVLGVRADFEARCAGYPELARAVQYRYLVTPMTGRQLRLAITGPAKAAGAHADDDLVDMLLGEVKARQPGGAGQGVLPLLSHALDQAWRSRSGDALTLGDYERAGGIEAAVATSAQRAYDDLTAGQQAAARQVFTRLAATSPDGVDTADRATRAELTEGRSPAGAADVEAVLEAFATERLLTLAADSVEISHEALLTAWPLLRDTWLAETHADRITRTRLRATAAEWEDHSRDQSYLYRGTLLQAAAEAASRITADPRRFPPLGQVAQWFLAASLEHQRAEQQAARRRRQRRRAVIASACAFVLAAGSVGVVALRQHQEATHNAAVTRSNDLAADAQALSGTDPGLAAQLAVAAYRSWPTSAASTQMYTALGAPLLDNILGRTSGNVLRVVTQADGRLAAAVDRSGNVQVWNLGDASKPVRTAAFTTGPQAIALAPREPLLAGGCGKKGLCLWQLADPDHPVRTAVLSAPASVPCLCRISFAAISPDGSLLAAASENGYTLVWSIARPAHPRLLAALPNPTTAKGAELAAVAFTPDSRILAETINKGATRLWAVDGTAPPAAVATIHSGYQDLAFTAKGLLAGVSDLELGLWNVRDPARPTALKPALTGTSMTQDLQALAVSPDGDTLAYGGTDINTGDASMCVLSLATAAVYSSATGSRCFGTGFGTITMTYTAAGELLTGGLDATIRLWRTPPTQIPDTETGTATTTSPDGRLLITPIVGPNSEFTSSSTMDVWDLDAASGPALDATLRLPSAAGYGSFLTNTVALTVTEGGSVLVWNLADPRHPRHTASLGPASQSTFSAGDLVSVLGAGGVVRLWRISGAGTATEVGSLTDPAASGAGLLGDGRTAVILTATGIDWWDISHPASPVKVSTSPLANVNKGTATTAGADLLAATAEADPVGGGAALNLYRVASGRVMSDAQVSRTAGGVLMASADGRLLAATGAAGNGLTLWDTSDPRAPRQLASLLTAPSITGVAFDPTGSLMADWTQQAVQLWDIRDPAQPVLTGTFSSTSQVANDTLGNLIDSAVLTSSGKLLVSIASAEESAIDVLDSSPGEAATQLCDAVTSPITTAQWTQSAPGIPYQNPCR